MAYTHTYKYKQINKFYYCHSLHTFKTFLFVYVIFPFLYFCFVSFLFDIASLDAFSPFSSPHLILFAHFSVFISHFSLCRSFRAWDLFSTFAFSHFHVSIFLFALVTVL